MRGERTSTLAFSVASVITAAQVAGGAACGCEAAGYGAGYGSCWACTKPSGKGFTVRVATSCTYSSLRRRLHLDLDSVPTELPGCGSSSRWEMLGYMRTLSTVAAFNYVMHLSTGMNREKAHSIDNLVRYNHTGSRCPRSSITRCRRCLHQCLCIDAEKTLSVVSVTRRPPRPTHATGPPSSSPVIERPFGVDEMMPHDVSTGSAVVHSSRQGTAGQSSALPFQVVLLSQKGM